MKHLNVWFHEDETKLANNGIMLPYDMVTKLYNFIILFKALILQES